jgi:Tfp pilus assembly protein PilO
MPDDATIELAKLASELETIKLLGVIITLSFVVIMGLAFIMSRSVRSQDKTNQSTVTGIFGITGRLVSSLENLDNTLRSLATDFAKSVKELEQMRIEQMQQNNRVNSLMLSTMDTQQIRAIMDRTDIPIPNIKEE